MNCVAPVERIELPSWALEALIMPLYYTGKKTGALGEIRTPNLSLTRRELYH